MAIMSAQSRVPGQDRAEGPVLEQAEVGEPGRGASVTGGVLLAAAVILTAANLRPAITTVGPLLDEMRASLGASSSWAGLLTTVPVLCFAFAGLAAPALARRVGVGVSVAIALVLLAVGLVLRVVSGPLTVLAGTLVGAIGIAFAAVLIPVVIKASYPAKIGMMTGFYTASLQTGATLGFVLTAPLDSAFGGWRPSLASWAVLAGVSLVVWLVAVVRGKLRTVEVKQAGGAGRSLMRNKFAWIITLFFGLQAFVAFVVMGWLPQVLIDAGVSRDASGLLLGLLTLMSVPFSFVLPPLAARSGSQTGWILGLGVCALAGLLGLLFAPGSVPLLWTVLLGTGMSVFSVALTTIALRARSGEDTAKLSGMAQGFGYLIAAVGPFLFGYLHDVSGGWTIPFLVLIGVLVVQMGFGAVAGRPRYL
jgi:CP family cyanate transporter-like MFS transporter